jgi:hypothetical protein
VKWEEASQRRKAAQLSLKREPLRLCNARRRGAKERRIFPKDMFLLLLGGTALPPQPNPS